MFQTVAVRYLLQFLIKLCCLCQNIGPLFPKKTYKEPVPIGEGAFVDVLVTHVVSPDEIFVQKVSTNIANTVHI